MKPDIKRLRARAEHARTGYGPDAPVSPAVKLWAERYAEDVPVCLDQMERDAERVRALEAFVKMYASYPCNPYACGGEPGGLCTTCEARALLDRT